MLIVLSRWMWNAFYVWHAHGVCFQSLYSSLYINMDRVEMKTKIEIVALILPVSVFFPFFCVNYNGFIHLIAILEKRTCAHSIHMMMMMIWCLHNALYVSSVVWSSVDEVINATYLLSHLIYDIIVRYYIASFSNMQTFIAYFCINFTFWRSNFDNNHGYNG